MKIFKWWHILIIILAVATIAALFLIVSFLTTIEDVQRWSLFSTMFFGLGSASMSLIALWISIHTFISEKKREKESLENQANCFIVDNSDEIQYIPLCLLASAYDRQAKYCRKIYLNFNKLNNDLQKEVLRQLNYECDIIKGRFWVNEGLDRVKTFISDYKLGRDLLYDNSKYYKRTFLYKENKYDMKIEYSHIFKSDIFGLPKYEIRNDKLFDKGICFFDYLKYFLNASVNDNPVAKIAPKPIDYLAEAIDFGNIDEASLCLWMMCIVDSCAELLIDKCESKQKITRLPVCDGNIETYEDRFLLSLSVLYDLSKYKDNKL